MDSFVVRIYRRNPKEPRNLAGVVERAGVEGERAFRDLDELLAILTSPVMTRRIGKSVNEWKKWTDNKWKENK
jgi:hypothetical protein